MNDERLDFDEYNELFEYDSETGALMNKVKRSTRALVGGSSTAKGRGGKLIVRHKGQILDAARIAWLLSTGNDPGENGVRCLNGDLSDLKSCNLSLVDSTDNAAIKEMASRLETEEKQSQEARVEQEKPNQAEQERPVNGEVIQLKNGKWLARVATGGGIRIVGHYETEAQALAAIGVIK